jgi:transporter family-2 protein
MYLSMQNGGRRVFNIIYAGLGAAAGVSFVIQQAVNANLRASIGSAAWAGFVSYFGGTLCMLILALALHEAAPGIAML